MASIPLKETQAPKPTDSIETRFDRLAAVWLAETAYVSSSSELVAHPAFREIVGMGPAIIPRLLRELEKRSGPWHRALRRIKKRSGLAGVGQGARLRMVVPSLEDAFPGQRGQPYRFTSPRDRIYNCIGFAAGDLRNWWWPDSLGEDTWPAGVPRVETVEAFRDASVTWPATTTSTNRAATPSRVGRQKGLGRVCRR